MTASKAVPSMCIGEVATIILPSKCDRCSLAHRGCRIRRESSANHREDRWHAFEVARSARQFAGAGHERHGVRKPVIRSRECGRLTMFSQTSCGNRTDRSMLEENRDQQCTSPRRGCLWCCRLRDADICRERSEMSANDHNGVSDDVSEACIFWQLLLTEEHVGSLYWACRAKLCMIDEWLNSC